MMKRLTWFVGGVAAGAIGAERAKRKVRTVAADLAPVHVARRVTQGVRRRGYDVADAVREGRRAMRRKEIELRARRDGRATTLAEELADELDAGTEILVDGRPVEPGRVVVLRQVRDTAVPPASGATGGSGPRRIARPRRRG